MCHCSFVHVSEVVELMTEDVCFLPSLALCPVVQLTVTHFCNCAVRIEVSVILLRETYLMY